MTGGLMQLVSQGSQDIYLTGEPEITFFKTIYKRYTNFAIEVMEKSLSGNINFNSSAYCTIPQNGDLITKTYLKIIVNGSSNNTGKWAFSNKLGHTLINRVQLSIHGDIIDTQYGEWFNIWNNFFRNPEHERGYNIMIGNTTDATTLSNSDKSVTLHIPLRFFFNKYNGLALPLIALQNTEVRFNFTFGKEKNCYIKEKNYFVGDTLTSFNVNLTLSDPKLLINYIFLDDIERKRFASFTHEYLIEQLQLSGNENIIASSLNSDKLFSYNINLDHPVKAIYWVIKNNNLNNGNAFLSINDLVKATKRIVLAYTDFSGAIAKGAYLTSVANVSSRLNEIITNTYTTIAIADESTITLSNGFTAIECDILLTASEVSDLNWITTLGLTATRNSNKNNPGNVAFDVITYQPDNFALYNDYTGQPMVSTELKLNGHNRFATQNSDYFTYVQSYESGYCSPSDGNYMYSFAINPEEHQPSGTCNFSKLDTTTLEVKLDSNITDSIISLYAVNYNIFKIVGGIGNIQYKN